MEVVNKYEICYGGNPEGGFSKDSLQSTRIIYATSEENVIEYCEKTWPNIFPIHTIKVVAENIDTSTIRRRI